MPSSVRQAILLALLALVFTIGLTFASVELPYLTDTFLQNVIPTPGGDSHASPAQIFRTELFISHFHLRLIGYVCFCLTVLLIIVGFATRRSGAAVLGALAFMLPVFAQFAGVMFFLAGLGILNVLWLPVLDISFDLQRLGLIIRAPYDLAMWLFHRVGINAYWPIVYLSIGGGLLIFFLGTFAWLSARSEGRNVADFWIYRFSRHPQYLGWILWTYGLFLLLMRGLYPKRSWGIDASFPWLISTMVIVGVAMIEELSMSRRHGQLYDEYRKGAPFLFPIPSALGKAMRWPFRVFFGKEWPDRPREVAIVLSLATAVLIGASALFYGGGIGWVVGRLQSEETQRAEIETLCERIKESNDRRKRKYMFGQIMGFGEAAIPSLSTLLEDEDPDLRQNAAQRLGELHSETAVPSLLAALNDPNNDVRYWVIRALETIGSQEARDPLLELLDRAGGSTPRAAARALASLGAEEVLPHLLKQLQDSLIWNRIGAAEDLGTLGIRAGVAPLAVQVGHPNPRMRRAVVAALVRIGSEDGLDALRLATGDEDWEVRVYAAEGVHRLERHSLVPGSN